MLFKVVLVLVGYLHLTPGTRFLPVTAATCQAKYQKVGCYERNKNLFGTLLLSHRDGGSGTQIVWKDFQGSMRRLSCECAVIAKAKGYSHFAITFYAECWGTRAEEEFKKSITSSKCIHDYGKICNDAEGNDKMCGGTNQEEYVYTILKEETVCQEMIGNYQRKGSTDGHVVFQVTEVHGKESKAKAIYYSSEDSSPEVITWNFSNDCSGSMFFPSWGKSYRFIWNKKQHQIEYDDDSIYSKMEETVCQEMIGNYQRKGSTDGHVVFKVTEVHAKENKAKAIYYRSEDSSPEVITWNFSNDCSGSMVFPSWGQSYPFIWNKKQRQIEYDEGSIYSKID